MFALESGWGLVPCAAPMCRHFESCFQDVNPLERDPGKVECTRPGTQAPAYVGLAFKLGSKKGMAFGSGRMCDISRSEQPRTIEMDSEKVARILGAIVAVAVLAIAVAYGPIGQIGKPQTQPQRAEQPAQPAPAPPPVRGPVVREVPQ